MDADPKDPLSIVTKLGGLGVLAALLRTVISRIWPTKKESLDAQDVLVQRLLKRIETLEADLGNMRADDEKRLEVLRVALAECRAEGARLKFEASMLGRFIPPTPPGA